MTICLFWINPEKFLPADHKTTAYGKTKGISAEPEDYQSYRQWLKAMTEQVGSNYPQVSHEAHLLATQPKPVVAAPPPSTGVAYWWLNANPKIWNFEETAVGEKQTYTSHNEKGNKRQKYRYFQEVKLGDLVVGYVTSPQKEVVAICKITIHEDLLALISQPLPI